MNIQFTRGEYWLLESVVDLFLPLVWLNRANLDEILNKPSHGLSRVDLVREFTGLLERGLIRVLRTDQDVQDPGVILANDKVDGAMEDPDLSYGLTPEGGAAWDAFAAPEWDDFFSTSYDLPDQDGVEKGEAIAVNRCKLEMFLDLSHLAGLHVLPDSIQWGTVSPWAATYWKQLPMGHRVSFRCHQDDIVDWNAIPHIYMDLWKWYRWG